MFELFYLHKAELYLGQITSGKWVGAQNWKCLNIDIQKMFKIMK